MNGKKGKNILGTFREYVETHDRIEPFGVLAKRWGASQDTVYRDHNELKREGYSFALAEPRYRGAKLEYDGFWLVTKRPEVSPVPEQLQVSAPEISEQPVLIPANAHADTTLEDLLRELISVTRRAWGIQD